MKFTMLMLMLVLLLVGCKSGGSDKVTSDSMTVVKNGMYHVCSNDEGYSSKSLISVTDTYLQESITFYLGSSCGSGNELYEIKTIFSPISLGGNQYRIRVESFMITPFDSTVRNEFNADSFCGIGSWTLNVPTNVLSRNCDGVTMSSGDEGELKMGMSGSNLSVISNGEKFTYASLNALNFTTSALTLQDGNYVYYDGTSGMFLNITGSNYTVTFYDEATRNFYSVPGTFIKTGNTVTFTVSSDSCDYTNGESFNMTYAQLSNSLGLRESGASDLLLEKVTFSTTQYTAAYLGGGYNSGCF